MQKILIGCFLLLSLKSKTQINTNSPWAWMKGESVSRIACVYGMHKITSNTNKSSARDGGISWTDASGNL